MLEREIQVVRESYNAGQETFGARNSENSLMSPPMMTLGRVQFTKPTNQTQDVKHLLNPNMRSMFEDGSFNDTESHLNKTGDVFKTQSDGRPL